MDDLVKPVSGMDRPVTAPRWTFSRWPLAARIGAVAGAVVAALIISAPVGVVTAIDLQVDEHGSAGGRLAEVTPESGMKLVADIDEHYLAALRMTGRAGGHRHRRPGAG